MLHVKIIKLAPNDQIHVKTNTTKIKIGLPPRKHFFNVISLTLLPHLAIK